MIYIIFYSFYYYKKKKKIGKINFVFKGLKMHISKLRVKNRVRKLVIFLDYDESGLRYNIN